LGANDEEQTSFDRVVGVLVLVLLPAAFIMQSNAISRTFGSL
jgi:hypothetical protein